MTPVSDRRPAAGLAAVIGTLAAVLSALPLVAAAQQNTTYRYQYDANGNLTQVADPLGHSTSYRYDQFNRLQQQQLPATTAGAAGPTLSYTYDGLDQLTGVTDPRNLVTTYQVDGLGNQSAVSSPDSGATTRTYDKSGQLQTSTDARGATTTATYDALNRLTSRTYTSGAASTFEYDGGATGAPYAIGHLTKMTDESGQTTYAYDAMGRLVTKVQTVRSDGVTRSFTVGYRYGSAGNALGHLTQLSYPSGFRNALDYDAGGRVANLGVIRSGTTWVTPALIGIVYIGTGQPAYWDFGVQDIEGNPYFYRGYDLDGRIAATVFGSFYHRVNRQIAYDAASRITALSDQFRLTAFGPPSYLTQSFGYDALDRLTQYINGTTSQQFQYDASGNRTQATFGSGTYNNSVSAGSNRLSASSGPGPARSNRYDPAGNLQADGTISYYYSARGRLRTTVGSTVTRYLYNGLGQRTAKLSAGGATYYVYDEQGHLLGEYDAAGNVLQETVFLGDIPVVASIKKTYWNGYVTVMPYWIYADHANTPRMLTDQSDQAVWRWDTADPFGLFAPDENPSGIGPLTYNPRFPGQLYDKETNLFYNYFRDYDPQQGRYIESDPIGLAGGINTYTYVLGNPLSYTDPRGQLTVAEAGVGGGLLACAIIPGCMEGLRDVAKRIDNACQAVGDKARNWYSNSKEADVPFTGPPGEWIDGRRRSRKYGPDGKPEVDIDNPHQGMPDTHVHEWPEGEREHPGRSVPW